MVEATHIGGLLCDALVTDVVDENSVSKLETDMRKLCGAVVSSSNNAELKQGWELETGSWNAKLGAAVAASGDHVSFQASIGGVGSLFRAK